MQRSLTRNTWWGFDIFAVEVLNDGLTFLLRLHPEGGREKGGHIFGPFESFLDRIFHLEKKNPHFELFKTPHTFRGAGFLSSTRQLQLEGLVQYVLTTVATRWLPLQIVESPSSC